MKQPPENPAKITVREGAQKQERTAKLTTPQKGKTVRTPRSVKKRRKRPDIFRRIPAANVDLATDIRNSILVQSPRGGRIILWITFILFFSAITWTYFAEVEEVTRAAGKVVPSRQLQVVQNLEGGILSEILVHVGDVVNKGQLLLHLDEKRFSGPYKESRFNYLSLKARVARLQAETNNTPFLIPEEVEKENPSVGDREEELFRSRQKEFEQTLGVLEEQGKQRLQEILELEAKIAQLTRSHNLLRNEINLTRPLVKAGAFSKVEFLRLQRQDNDMQGQITASKLSLPRAKSRLEEANKAMAEERLKFTNAAKKELNESYGQLEALSASSVAIADRLHRTAVRSPVRGIINRIFVNTVGGVVQPGMKLIEIVPLEDTLLIEAKVKPSDIAFLRPDLKAIVKFTAYEFTMYGGLEAKVEHISADSIVDEHGMSYYLVNLRTNKNYLGTVKHPFPIIPGMVTSVEILTGKKRVLTYLMKPILRAQSIALRER